MQKALALIPSVTSYSQYVETQIKIDNRTLRIVGIYTVDNATKQFASYSTTTLLIGNDAKPHIFTHQNIAAGDTVYFKIESQDALLKSSIQSSPHWRSFKNSEIPKNFTSIAIAGPIQDNLAVLSERGTYITLQRNSGTTQWGEESLLRYTFILSKKAFAVSDGPLNALVQRIGQQGTVDVWIDPQSFKVRHMVFANAPYFSTTTISHLNTPLPFEIPVVRMVQ